MGDSIQEFSSTDYSGGKKAQKKKKKKKKRIIVYKKYIMYIVELYCYASVCMFFLVQRRSIKTVFFYFSYDFCPSSLLFQNYH